MPIFSEAQQSSLGRRSRGLRGSAAIGVFLSVFVAGCDFNPLEQEAPSRIDAGALLEPSSAELLVRSAVSDFECALAQHIFATGLVGDELRDGSLSEQFWDFDRRTLSPARGQYATNACNGILPGNYMALSAARFQADNALQLLEGWTDEEVPNRMSLLAQSAAIAGYSLVLMGETFCSAALDLGPELGPDELFAEAENRFTRALAAAEAAGNAEIANLSRVGRARTRLNLGDLSGAASDAALVPEGFEYHASYSDAATRRQNRLFTAMYRNPVATVDPTFRDLSFDGVPDPRVEVIDAGTDANDANVALFQAAKYSEVSAPIRVASWEEAQLILAEAHLADGNPGAAADIINTLHAQAGLPEFEGTGAEEVREHLIEERRRELFLEGHRLGDLIRYDLPLDPAPGETFHRGGTFGSQLCFPLPDVERNNNPNI